jgi:hypothetical protein
MRQRSQDLFLTYILPIALAVMVLALSQLLNLVKISNLLEACALCGIVICGLFIGQYFAFKTLRLHERDTLYGILTVISFSRSHHVPNSGILSERDVLGIESTAREVWVYAYDLNYERFDQGRSPFTNAVVVNLTRGVKYRYLIPDTPDIVRRAGRMCDYLRQYETWSGQVEFLIVTTPPTFNQFGVTLYNPNQVNADDDYSTIAVYFPHAKDFQSVTDPRLVPFIAVREVGALEIQEELEKILETSRIFPLPGE